MTQPSRRRPRTGPWIVISILLAVTLIGTLWVPFYARTTPAIGGFPFFYWYQLLWVPIVAVLGGICYWLTRVARSGSSGTGAAGAGQSRSGSEEVSS